MKDSRLLSLCFFSFLLLSSFSLSLPEVNAPSQTRIFDSTTQTVNSLTANRLETTTTGSATTYTQVVSSGTAWFGLAVCRVQSSDTETVIDGTSSSCGNAPATAIVCTSTTSTTFALKSCTVNMPQTVIAAADSVAVSIYCSGDGSTWGNVVKKFTTAALHTLQIDAATWTVKMYVARATASGGTCQFQVVAGSGNNGLISNFSFSDYANTVSWTTGFDQPVGWWHLDDGAGFSATDSSPFGNTGTLASGGNQPSWLGSGCQFSNCLSFTGSSNQYVSVSDAPSLDPLSISIILWVKPASLNPSSYTVIVEKNAGCGDGTAGFCFFIPTSSSTATCDFVNTSGTEFKKSTPNLSTSSWQQIACTFDGSNVCAYLNGVSNGCTTFTGTYASDTGLLAFGAQRSVSHGYDGKEDEISIYSFAASSSQIASLYNLNAAVRLPNFSNTLGATNTITKALSTTWTFTTKASWFNAISKALSTVWSFTASKGYSNTISKAFSTTWSFTGIAAFKNQLDWNLLSTWLFRNGHAFANSFNWNLLTGWLFSGQVGFKSSLNWNLITDWLFNTQGGFQNFLNWNSVLSWLFSTQAGFQNTLNWHLLTSWRFSFPSVNIAILFMPILGGAMIVGFVMIFALVRRRTHG